MAWEVSYHNKGEHIVYCLVEGDSSLTWQNRCRCENRSHIGHLFVHHNPKDIKPNPGWGQRVLPLNWELS